MNDEIVLSDHDVVCITTDQSFSKTTTSRVGELKIGMIKQCLGDSFSVWITKGVPGQVLLESGGGWQKGQIRIRFEFIPDPPPEENRASTDQVNYSGTVIVLPAPSPLDELRSKLDIH
jgi:hypothetical protein